MRHNLPVELVTQYDQILELIRNRILFGIAAVPNLCLAEKAESRMLDHLGCPTNSIGAEEDGGPEDSFEGGHQSPVLLSAFMHSEGFQHFGGSAEANRLALLVDGKRGQINRHDSILAKRQTVTWMPGDLENEVAVSPLVQHLAGRRVPHREPAQDKWSRTEPHVLLSFLALHAYRATAFGLPQFLF